MSVEKQLRVRVKSEIADKIDEISKEINKSVPGAGASVSTITRYALEDYVRKYGKKDSTVYLELNTNIPKEDLKELEDSILKIMTIYSKVYKSNPFDSEIMKKYNTNSDLFEVVQRLYALGKTAKTRETYVAKKTELYQEYLDDKEKEKKTNGKDNDPKGE